MQTLNVHQVCHGVNRRVIYKMAVVLSPACSESQLTALRVLGSYYFNMLVAIKHDAENSKSAHRAQHRVKLLQRKTQLHLF